MSSLQDIKSSSTDLDILYEKISILIFFVGLFFLPLFFAPGHSYYFSEISKFILFFTIVHISTILFLYTQYKKSVVIPNHILFASAFFVFLFIFLSALISKIYAASWVNVEASSIIFLFLYLFFFILFFSAYVFKTRRLILYIYEIIVFSFLIIFLLSIIISFFQVCRR